MTRTMGRTTSKDRREPYLIMRRPRYHRSKLRTVRESANLGQPMEAYQNARDTLDQRRNAAPASSTPRAPLERMSTIASRIYVHQS